MAIWRLDDPSKDKTYDDKLPYRPGEEGFTRDLAKKYFKTNAFSYVGTPDASSSSEPVITDEPAA